MGKYKIEINSGINKDVGVLIIYFNLIKISDINLDVSIFFQSHVLKFYNISIIFC